MTIAVDETVIHRAITSLNQAVDWIESATEDDLRAAAEIVNLVLDDLEALRTKKSGAREMARAA